jgi:5-methyltetrahydrofolate--homocysteine methyltransferase
MSEDVAFDTRFREAVLDGDAQTAGLMAQEALAAGRDPQEVLDQCLVPAMDEAGRRFEAGDFFVPELLVAARAMKAAMVIIEPVLQGRAAGSGGRIAIGTVKGDLHDIGKNLVATMFRGAGFEVEDLGVDVSPDRFVAAVRDGATIVGLSALLTTTMMAMRTTIEAIEKANLRDRVAIIVGGAPVTNEFAVRIGADGYSDNAAAAVTLARRIVAERSTPRS